MNTRLTFLLAIALLLALPPAFGAVASDHPLVRDVVFDVTRELDVAQLVFTQQCEVSGSSTFPVQPAPAQRLILLPGAHGFRFEETNGDAPTAPGEPPGYDARGCGIVSVNTTIPAGTNHIHVRFDADREVHLRPNSLQAAFGARFLQDFAMTVPSGTAVRANYYNTSEGARNPTPIDLEPPLYPGTAPRLEVAWTFADRGTDNDASVTKFYSGGAYASTVTNVAIEFSGIAIPDRVITEEDVRSGTILSHEVHVLVPVAAALLEDGDTDLRIRLDPSVSFTKLIAPDGVEITDRATRFGNGPSGFNHSRVLLERIDDYTQITVPGPILRAHGAGTYQLVEAVQSDVRAVPALIPFAVLMLLLPFPFAAIAFVNVRVFEREAFGGFRRSARNLRYALVAAVLYYLIVLGAAFFGGRLALMANYPPSIEAVFLYLQVLLAGVAFVALWLVARELYNITVPRPPPEERNA